MYSYNEPFNYLREYRQRRIKLLVFRNGHRDIRLLIGRKNSSGLERAIAARIILKEALQNPYYQENKDQESENK